MKKLFPALLLISVILVFTDCLSEKNSLFNDSEWIMKNYDSQGKLYYHHLILGMNHSAMLRASYSDSSNIIVWSGKYKINSKKIIFDFTECVRYENGEIVGQYTSGKLIKYYSGEFFYSLAELGELENRQYHMELIRPKNYFYGENKDIFGNQMEEFIKVK